MNREIKFRGYSDYHNKFIFGFYVDKGDSHFIYESDYAEKEYVNAETIGQYTGLKDALGSEIYEGDILDQSKFPEDDACPYSVVYEDGSFRINYVSWVDNIKKPVLDNHRISICDDIVIGNIHENPEILN